LIVIADSSALISLDKIGHLEVLRRLFPDVVVPAAVAREVSPRMSLPSWIQVRTPTAPHGLDFPDQFGPGECEAIALAVELRAFRLIVDEIAARRFAARLGIAIVGTAGVLGLAKADALIPQLKPALDALCATGFYLSDTVYNSLLRDAGEL
jgi:predicted nucleic acid-binding protein